MVDDGELRVSDAEREEVADRLREAAGDGRLDTEELEERLTAVYGSRTRRELTAATADLPRPPAVVPPAPPVWHAPAVRAKLASFITVNATCIAIWAATGAGGGFWPFWIMLFTGVGLFGALVRSALGVEDKRAARRRSGPSSLPGPGPRLPPRR